MSTSDENLNILYVGTLPPHPGGSAISASQLLVGLAKTGHRINALAPITAEALSSGDSFAAEHPEISVTRYLVPKFDILQYIPSKDLRQVENEQIETRLPTLILNKRPDLIFIGRESFAWHVPDLAKMYGLPSIMRVAGGVIFGILNGNYSENERSRLIEQFQKIHLTITPANHLAGELKHFGLHSIKTILNAIDLQQFYSKPKDPALLNKLAIQQDDIIVAYIANLHQRKRPLDLIASAEQSLLKNPRLIYLMIGDGPLRKATEDMCRQKHLLDRFRFMGWIEYHRVPDYINLTDIVVMLSEWEGLARVYLEAQACNRVLLASDIPPAREVIIEGETGFLFRLGDIEDLTNKTLLAASHPKLRMEIGNKARKHVEAHHSIHQAICEYAQVFEEVVRNHKEIIQ